MLCLRNVENILCELSCVETPIQDVIIPDQDYVVFIALDQDGNFIAKVIRTRGQSFHSVGPQFGQANSLPTIPRPVSSIRQNPRSEILRWQFFSIQQRMERLFQIHGFGQHFSSPDMEDRLFQMQQRNPFYGWEAHFEEHRNPAPVEQMQRSIRDFWEPFELLPAHYYDWGRNASGTQHGNQITQVEETTNHNLASPNNINQRRLSTTSYFQTSRHVDSHWHHQARLVQNRSHLNLARMDTTAAQTRLLSFDHSYDWECFTILLTSNLENRTRLHEANTRNPTQTTNPENTTNPHQASMPRLRRHVDTSNPHPSISYHSIAISMPSSPFAVSLITRSVALPTTQESFYVAEDLHQWCHAREPPTALETLQSHQEDDGDN